MAQSPENPTGDPTNPDQGSSEIRRVNRMFLPILRLLSDENRLSILEHLAYNGASVPLAIQHDQGIHPSSFFKFANELANANLIKSSQGHYAASESGRLILDEIIDLGERLNTKFYEDIIDDLRRKSVSEEKLSEIRRILLETDQQTQSTT